MKKARMFFSVFWILLGAVLSGCAVAGLLDSFWSGMGAALIVVGALQLIRQIRYRTNKDYQEKFDTEVHDERNKFLSNKAWAWTGYWLVLFTVIGTIGFKLMGREDLMMFCSGSVCLMLVLYWLNYLYLSRKY